MKTKLARTRFGAAMVLYLLWLGALVTLAVVSGSRPGDRKPHQLQAPALSAPEAEPSTR